MLKSKHMPSLRSAASSVDLFVAWPKSAKPKEISPKEMKTTTTTVRNKAKGIVLLYSTKATAVNDVISETAFVRIHLDTGSQRTYVTNRWKSKLNLSPVKWETLHLNTFGYERYTKQQCDVVNSDIFAKFKPRYWRSGRGSVSWEWNCGLVRQAGCKESWKKGDSHCESGILIVSHFANG